MRALTLHSTYGVIIHRDFIPLYLDDNYAHIFGYDSADDMLNNIDTLLDLISPDERDIAQKNNADMLTGKVEATTGTRINITAKGETITVLTLDQVIEWEGKPALRVTVVDLTLLEKANKKIRDNEEQYRQLITQSKQGILIHRNFKPLLVNESWVKLYRGLSVQAVMESNILDRVPKDFRQLAQTRNKELLDGLIDGGRSLVDNLCFDGSIRSFNLYENKIMWDGEPAVQTVAEDITDRVRLEKELAYKASHDQLTDLYNREAIFDWLANQKELIRSLACLLIDIDNFKNVNDHYGHHAGDTVIKAFASLCQSAVNSNGIVGRWGGEEFLVLLPNASLDNSVALAETIRDNMETKGCHYGDIRIRTTVSIGISIGHAPLAISQFEKLLKQADEKMYVAKNSGKNRVIS
jgi:diguanylate cyclase (GGDEF)-like protein/PAS domain S-box-containing protein